MQDKMYTPELMKEEFGIDASNYLLYRTFLGDKSDNIPGVKGVALKSLIKYFPMMTENRSVDLDELLEHAHDGKDRYKIYKSVIESEDQVNLNRSLMQLKEVDIAGNLKMMIHDKVTGPVDKLNTFQFKKMFMQDKMYTVIKDLDTWLATSFNSLNAYASMEKN